MSQAYRDNFKLIRWDKPVSRERRVYLAPARSDLPAPMIISDHMEAAEHPCTGAMIDSKSRFERITREHGCVTIGNDSARLRNTKEKKPDRKQIRESLQRSFAQHGLS